MKSIGLKFAGSLLLAGTLVSGASAQSINPALDQSQGETQIVGAVTIPLGQSNNRSRTAPRLEIIGRSRQDASVFGHTDSQVRTSWNERRVGLTLDGNQTLMLNGQPIPETETQDGISTLGAVAIGVGVLAILSVAVIADGVDAIEDLTDPD